MYFQLKECGFKSHRRRFLKTFYLNQIYLKNVQYDYFVSQPF